MLGSRKQRHTAFYAEIVFMQKDKIVGAFLFHYIFQLMIEQNLKVALKVTFLGSLYSVSQCRVTSPSPGGDLAILHVKM